MEHIDYLMKIVLIGDEEKGKTQIIQQWVNNKLLKTASTIGVEFCTKSITYLDTLIKLQIWDTAGQARYASLIPSYLRSVQLIFIVIAANDSKAQKIDQIDKWLILINKNCPPETKVIILESKIDLPDATRLTDADLEQFNGRYAYKVSVSALQSESFAELDAALQSILPQIFPALASLSKINKPAPLLTIRTAYAETITNINALNDIQVKMLLLSLRKLFTHGPINQPNKSYDMKFGGGRLLQLDEKVPEHVFDWVNHLNFYETSSTPADKRKYLISLYDDIIRVSQQKPFTRSSSTHNFYKTQLPGFIEYCVKKSADENFPYFLIRENLRKLSDYPENTGFAVIRQNLINHLQLGPLNNQTVPYNVTFFGSKKHKLPDTQNSIAVPAHVASILNYLINDATSNFLKLLFILDYCIATKFSTCTSRENSTQVFYDNLPAVIARIVADKLQILQDDHALHPPINLT